MGTQKKYIISTKLEFEMIGRNKQECQTNLMTLLDALVECHSNQSDCPDFFHEFTGKYPILKTFKAKLVKGE